MENGTVLYVGNFELPDKGASANRVVSNAEIFRDLGYKTILLGISDDADGLRCLNTGEKILMCERSSPKSIFQWFKHMCSVKYLGDMLKLHKDIKLIILYNMPYLSVKSARRFCRKNHIKLAYDCTEWTGVTDGGKIKQTVKNYDLKLIKTKLEKQLDGLIVISSLMDKHYKISPRLMLPPLVDISDSIWHQKPRKSGSAFEFCFAGMLDGNKDSLDILVSAFLKVIDSSTTPPILRIIGVGKDEFLEKYNGFEDLPPNIVFMGKLSHFETLGYVLGCDAYVFVREKDERNNVGFPTKFAEAHTCGVPVIATDISDISKYADKENTVILKSTNVLDLAEAMREISEKKVRRNSTLKDTFYYKKYLHQTVNWLHSVMAGDSK